MEIVNIYNSILLASQLAHNVESTLIQRYTLWRWIKMETEQPSQELKTEGQGCLFMLKEYTSQISVWKEPR